VRKRRANSPIIFEIPRMAEVKREAPEQQMATCERGNNIEEDIHCQKCPLNREISAPSYAR